jgi:flagella basal body P-ring formation protein FlgA
MRNPFAALPLLLLVLPLPALAAHVLTLVPTALADGNRVTLADVARAPADAAPGLAKVDLAAAPLPGYTLRLTRAEIARILRTRGLPYALAPDGADVVRVERRSQPFDPARVTQAAAQALQTLAAAEGIRLELGGTAPLPDLPLPTGAVDLRVRPVTPQVLRQRRPTVWVDVLVEGAFFRTVPVGFELHAWRPALVAVRALGAGSTPACADFAVRDVDLTALPGTAVADCRAVQGRLARALDRDEPLLQGQLKEPAAVAQGDTVTLQFTDGAIVLEGRATALSDGAVGDRIDVRPSGARQAVRADVAGAGIVRITGK